MIAAPWRGDLGEAGFPPPRQGKFAACVIARHRLWPFCSRASYSGAAAADELIRYAIVGDAIPRPLTASRAIRSDVLRIYKTDFGRSRHPGRD
jgi:hypothetical protein